MKTHIEVSELEPGLRALAFFGRIDAQSADALREALAAVELAAGERLLADLEGVDFLDSMGLGVIAGLIRRAGASRATLVLCGAPEPVRRTLEIAQFHRVVDVLADRATARVWLAASEETAP